VADVQQLKSKKQNPFLKPEMTHVVSGFLSKLPSGMGLRGFWRKAVTAGSHARPGALCWCLGVSARIGTR
jgi:hypothetical protein